MRLGEPRLVHAQEFLEVLLNQAEERRVSGPAFGSTLHEMATGKKAFSAVTLQPGPANALF